MERGGLTLLLLLLPRLIMITIHTQKTFITSIKKYYNF